MPPAPLNVLTAPWPFAMWGVDMIGEIKPTASNGHRFILVAIDYFTKWAEAEPLAMITTKKVLDFVIKNIVCRYGFPRKIVSNNGTQFDSDLFTDFCEKYDIIKSFSSVAYLQTNGEVKVVNKTLKASLKKRLDKVKGLWPE